MAKNKRKAPCGSTRLGHRIQHMLGIPSYSECARNIADEALEGLADGFKNQTEKRSGNMQAKGYEIKCIEIDGVLYDLEKREAEVGERVIYMYNGKTDGVVTKVTKVGVGSISIEEYVTEDEDGDDVTVSGFEHGVYRVLVPQASAKVPAEPPRPPKPDALDLISNLSVAVAKLQRQVAELTERTGSSTDDLRTFAEEFTEFKAEQSDLNEMLLGDIVTIDERTQPKEITRTVTKEMAKGASIRGVFR